MPTEDETNAMRIEEETIADLDTETVPTGGRLPENWSKHCSFGDTACCKYPS
ncbi:MAG: hypothetical protein L0I76_13085 [Pseudonocardia sp.]|nr:hypothetical protein [Pseudonocardia sp.]